MQAILLCAGKGKRLGLEKPKCMIEVNGYPLLQYQLDILLRLKGLEEILIVAGYKKYLIDEYVKEYITKYKPTKRITIIPNPNFESYGIVYSMECTKNYIKSDTILRISGDIFIEDISILEKLISFDKTTFLLQPILSHRRKNVAVATLKENRLNDILVQDNPKTTSLEWTDIEIYKNNDLNKILSHVEYFRKKSYNYCDLLNFCIRNKLTNTNIFQISGSLFEIDTYEDLQKLKMHFAQLIANEFWKNIAKYPDFKDRKERLLQDFNYLYMTLEMLKIYSVLDLGCGGAEGLKLLQESYLTHRALYGYDLDSNFYRQVQEENKDSKIKFLSDKTSITKIPKVDFTYSFGAFHYVIDDIQVHKFLKKINSKYFLLRCPCSMDETLVVNKYSKELKSQYAAIYRTIPDVLNLFIDQWKVKEIIRSFPDDIESKFGTKQFYFLFEKKGIES